MEVMQDMLRFEETIRGLEGLGNETSYTILQNCPQTVRMMVQCMKQINDNHSPKVNFDTYERFENRMIEEYGIN